MAEGTSSRLAPDTQQLLRLMAMRSDIVDRGLGGHPRIEAIEELPPAEPSILDQLVQARVEVEEESLAAMPEEVTLPESASELEELAEDIEEVEPELLELEPELDIDAELDLLELNAGEAGLPAELAGLPPETAPEEPVAEDEALDPVEPDPAVEYSVESDLLLAEPLLAIEETTVLLADEPAEDEEDPEEIEELPAAEELPPAEEPPAFQRHELREGPGEDFQALLSGARDGEVPLLPADADVRLRARNGPKPGAEFVGKTTLAGATGLYCLIERFSLPEGTRMKVTLSAPRFADRFEIQDAVVTRVRRAPGNSTEVQLAFDEPREEFEEFIARHFGDKPVGFALFSRRRPKR